MLTHELRYKILRILKENPELSQRELAKGLSISLGKVNFCLQALIETGLIKAKRFRNSKNKLAYAYLLTPGGIKEKSRVTISFLKRKLEEHANLKNEIESLRKEVAKEN